MKPQGESCGFFGRGEIFSETPSIFGMGMV